MAFNQGRPSPRSTARFKGRGAADDVRRLVTVLQRDGQVRRTADGGRGV